MKSLYMNKIDEEQLGQYLPQVNLSERDKEIVKLYLEEHCNYHDLGARFNITGERVRQIIERFARKAHHALKKNTIERQNDNGNLY